MRSTSQNRRPTQSNSVSGPSMESGRPCRESRKATTRSRPTCPRSTQRRPTWFCSCPTAAESFLDKSGQPVPLTDVLDQLFAIRASMASSHAALLRVPESLLRRTRLEARGRLFDRRHYLGATSEGHGPRPRRHQSHQHTTSPQADRLRSTCVTAWPTSLYHKVDSIPESKFSALSTISDPSVIKPTAYCSTTGTHGRLHHAGRSGHSLCQLFHARLSGPVQRSPTITSFVSRPTFRGHVQSVHASRIPDRRSERAEHIVGPSFDSAFMIDVDSYQTPGYPATVIMPSVRDYSVHAAHFSELSDWFSFAVLAFQLFVGVHPTRDTQAVRTSAKDKRLEHRMRQHISAFRQDVSLPRCCYPFDVVTRDIPRVARGCARPG